MARIVPPLEADDHIRTAGQPVNDLALALVTPLGADHGDVGHFMLLDMLPGPHSTPSREKLWF
ncbi:hypothetical protein SXCC_03171 [Gluconacetobacter sp. SXCC-1]|nr:hypothetical protein SXCC_03171 [Gluconacetobacter sp. SXCC-1]